MPVRTQVKPRSMSDRSERSDRAVDPHGATPLHGSGSCAMIKKPAAPRAVSSIKASYCASCSKTGAYVRATGGPGLFLLEWRSAVGQHHRGAQRPPMAAFAHGTVLFFNAPELAFASGDWFLASQLRSVFEAFMADLPFPAWIRWSASSADAGAGQVLASI
jgi:hypothetical protein